MTDKVSHFPEYVISRLEKKHDKNTFNSKSEFLNQYLKTQASQDIKKNVAVIYVLTIKDSEQVLAYYTLSSIGIFAKDLPDNFLKKLPRYPILPGVLLGRLAVDNHYEGKGLGRHLIIDAFKKTLMLSNEIGITAIIVDAKDETAVSFYKYYGFIELPDNQRRLFLPLSTIKQLEL